MKIGALTVVFFAISAMAGAQAANPTKGKAVYDSFCWVCHGKYGRGDGPAARNLKLKPRNLTDHKYMSQRSDEELFQWISGRNPDFRIPAHSAIWRETLSEGAVRDVIAYVRTLASPTLKGSVASGQNLFDTYCWVCHGRAGRGDGPAAANLKVKPRDLTDAEFRARTGDQKLFEAIRTGAHQSLYMPIWGTSLKRQEIWDIVEYIKTLPTEERAGK